MSFVRYCSLVVLFGIFGMLATPVKSDSINLWKTLMFPCMQQINCIPNFVLEISKILQIFLGTLDRPGQKYKSNKRQYQLAENFDVYLHAKNQLHGSLFFLRHCKDIAQLLFTVVQECLAAPIRNDNTNFLNNLMFFWTKINFISHVFFEILQSF